MPPWITCGEFGRMPLLRALVLVGWVGGFYDGRKNDTKVEVLAFADMAERMNSPIRDNELMRLMALVEAARRGASLSS